MRVNGVEISQADIRVEMARIRAEIESSGRELLLDERMRLRDAAIEQVVERVLLHQEADRLQLVPTEAEVVDALQSLAPRVDGASGCRAGAVSEEAVADLRRRLQVDMLLRRWTEKAKKPSRGQIESYYRTQKERFYAPARVHAAHVVAAECEAAEAMRNRILAGEDFGAVAADASDCPEKRGDLGWFERGTMVEEFDEVVFAAPLQQPTPVFQTSFGFHVAIVYDRKPEGIRPFEEVAPEIEERLHRLSQDDLVARRMEELQEKAVLQEF